ncbi:MAG: helix-turn-helix domain-containing protein [Candidatus Woesearchaeota archaeon]|jgi:sugar-specific transcriptional regulator TrmB
MNNRYLSELGFTEGEEKVYLALLKLGSSTSGPIAKEANVSRSKLYEILEKLARKGIVSHQKKNNVKYFEALPPKRILDYIKEKEKQLEQHRLEFENKLPLLDSLTQKKELMQEAQVYEGMEGIKNVRELALNKMNSDECIYYFGNPASGHEHVLGYWDDWNERRIKKKISSCIIYNQDAKEYGERRKKQKYTKVKYLAEKGSTDAWIEIYGNTVAIVMKKETPMSIVLNNEYVAESFKTYFRILWKTSKNKI